MKKRFALYGMFAAMAIFATACGDDSSSGPEEESSSSIEAEDESSSSVEEGKSSAKEEGKSSAADKKSSSSEAKKGDSSSSEEATSSSSEAVSSSSVVLVPQFPYCNPGNEGGKAVLKFGAGMIQAKWSFDLDSEFRTELEYIAPTCEEIENASSQAEFFYVHDECAISSCAVEGSVAKWSTKCTDSFLQSDDDVQIAMELWSACSDFYSSFSVVTTDYLKKQMLEDDVYGMLVDYRNLHIYRTIKIGNQTWMAQNMNYEPSSGSSCYGKIDDICFMYGRLYTWEAAQTACPTGWRLPSVKEWETLLVTTMNATKTMEGGAYITYSGADISLLGGGSYANSYGLSFVLGGAYGEPGDETPEYNSLGSSGVYWLGDEPQEGNVPVVSVEFDDGTSERSNQFVIPEANIALSVRCIKDDAPSQSVSSN